MIIFFRFAAESAGNPRPSVTAELGMLRIAVMTAGHSAVHASNGWVLTQGFGYLSGEEGMFFPSLVDARSWFIRRLGERDDDVSTDPVIGWAGGYRPARAEDQASRITFH